MHLAADASGNDSAKVLLCDWQSEVAPYPASLVAACRQSPDFPDVVVADGLPPIENVGGMPLIVLPGTPLQVFSTVVRLDAVEVVYHVAAKWPRQKRRRDESVNMDLLADADFVVPDLQQVRPKHPIGDPLDRPQGHDPAVV